MQIDSKKQAIWHTVTSFQLYLQEFKVTTTHLLQKQTPPMVINQEPIKGEL